LITSREVGYLPAIKMPSKPMPAVSSVTLTEVVTAAVYGLPLKPGKGIDTLRKAYEPLLLEGRTLWRCSNGPGWIVGVLDAAARDTAPQDPVAISEEDRSIALGQRTALEIWLKWSRKLAFAYALPAELAEKVIRLAAMSDAEAIAYARAEASRIELAEAKFNEAAQSFFDMLSAMAYDGKVVLRGIPTNAVAEKSEPNKSNDAPHRAIQVEFYELPLIHCIFENVLEVDRFNPAARSLDGIFERIEREKSGALFRWSDIRLSADHARILLSEIAGPRNRIQPGKTKSRTKKVSKIRRKRSTTNRGYGEMLRVAFKACYPAGVKRGLLAKEVHGILSVWIEAEYERKAPCIRTFYRHMATFMTYSSDNS